GAQKWREANPKAPEAEPRVNKLQEGFGEADQPPRAAETERNARQQACTAAHVGLAKIEERLSSLSLQHDQLESDLGLRRQEVTQCEQSLASGTSRLAESQQAMLNASAALAQGFLD